MVVFAQTPTWILNPNRVDFEPFQVNQLFQPTGFSYTAENAVFDQEDGSLIFYVRDESFFDSNGQSFGFLPNAFAENISKEIAILPLPGTCNQWCVFMGTIDVPNVNNLHMVEVYLDETGNPVVGNTEILETFFQPISLAVSKVIPNTTVDRYLYTIIGGHEVRRATISSEGLSDFVSVGTIGEPNGSGGQSEFDIDPTNSFGAVGFDNTLNIFQVPELTQPLQYTFPKGGTIRGLEWRVEEGGEQGLSLYVSHSSMGLLKTKIIGNTLPSNPIFVPVTSKPTNFSNTQIEQAVDGNLYLVENGGKLFRLDASDQVASVGVSISSNHFTFFNNMDCYALPDQVDGESYDAFVGITPLEYEHVSINGTDLPTTAGNPSDLPLFINCETLLFEVFGDESAPDNLNYTIRNVNSNGTPLPCSDPDYICYTSNNLAASAYTALDLRCLASPACDLFDPYVDQEFFSISVSGSRGRRCAEDNIIGYFRLTDLPVTAGLEVNSCGTNPNCVNIGNPNSPCSVGTTSVSINAENSTGDITYLDIDLEEYDCSGGGPILGDIEVNNGQPFDVTGSQLSAINLNSIPIAGQLNYFNVSSDPNQNPFIGRCFKITVTVGNQCGFASQVAYIRFDGTCLHDPDNDENSFVIPGSNTSATQFQLFPNPVENTLQIKISKSMPSIVRTEIFDSSGKVIRVASYRQSSSFNLDTSSLPQGLYNLRIVTTTDTEILPFIKG